jgi:DNA (cytosine-5)-methyltransferase 1
MAVKPRPVGIDFFCGCGGMTLGLRKAGVEVRLGIDLDPLCRNTYERNIGVRFECLDIRTAVRSRSWTGE